ncbi:uncharacterized protein LOC115876544 [Sitophilus oryzae]|uniref:Uncharacterized protein LOC115876544 n=1 Tax=Sitophilus oryzae TaxID=7048 RepID=A0A6J2XAM9_SITOR|nr:uncharacterized protein LOC115876544 [Sitophilus oryzae]
MSLKNGRACGPEGVYAELIKSGSKKLFRMLTNIVNQCLNGQPVPEQWKKAYISSIYKKGSRKDPNNYRGISVTSTMSRLYGRILRNLIEEEYSSYEEEEQNGFRSGRSCTDNIFALKQIIEKKSAMNQEVDQYMEEVKPLIIQTDNDSSDDDSDTDTDDESDKEN